MGMFRDEGDRWCAVYVVASCLANVGQGLVTTVVGPTQLYLAKNVDVNIDTINLVWTFGFAGYFLGAFGTGFVFKRFFHSSLAKVTFVGVSMALNGLLMCLLPFLRDFSVLALFRVAQYVALGTFITADASMLVYTMGPVRSRPFTNALHASVGVGFLVGTFLVRPFLPEGAGDKAGHDQVCNPDGGSSDDSGSSYQEEYLGGISKIAWPFLLTGGWCVAVSVIYVVLGLMPMKMPRFYEDNPDEQVAAGGGKDSRKEHSETRVRHWRALAAGVVVYYTLSCGIERIYQPMAYTFGLCGPLGLTSQEAVVTDSSYNGGFMAGRIVSIFLVKIVRPRNLIISSVLMCVVSAVALVAWASVNKYLLYLGTAALGFFISWQFGCGYSWTAQKMDITGRLSPIFFVGCGIGGCIFPPLTGYVFTNLGHSSMLHLTLIACVAQCLTYAYMYAVSRARVDGGAAGQLRLDKIS